LTRNAKIILEKIIEPLSIVYLEIKERKKTFTSLKSLQAQPNRKYFFSLSIRNNSSDMFKQV
jgi:hypothetical protein